MAKIYKCPFCSGTIDADSEYDWRRVGNRVWHDSCWEQRQKESGNRNEIHAKCREIFAEEYSRARIDKQIDSLLASGRTAKGIYKTLEYWYDIKGNSTDLANGGIGIVDYVYNEAAAYYKRLRENKERYKGINSEALESFEKLRETRDVPEKRIKLSKPKRTNYVILD